MKREKRIEEAEPTTGLKQSEESETSPKKPTQKVDRVVIGGEALARLDAWVRQVEASRPGVELSRRDVTQWLILKHGEVLTPSELKELSEAHYNELRFLHYAIRELKAAKLRGEAVSLQDMMGSLSGSARMKDKPTRAKKKVSNETGTEGHVPVVCPVADDESAFTSS